MASAVLITDSADRILVLQRPKGGIWEELWELPTFERKISEDAQKDREDSSEEEINCDAGLADVLRNELGLAVALERESSRVTRMLTHRRLDFRVHRGRCAADEPKVMLPACERGRYQAYRWVRIEALAMVPMATAMNRVTAAAQKCRRQKEAGCDGNDFVGGWGKERPIRAG